MLVFHLIPRFFTELRSGQLKQQTPEGSQVAPGQNCHFRQFSVFPRNLQICSILQISQSNSEIAESRISTRSVPYDVRFPLNSSAQCLPYSAVLTYGASSQLVMGSIAPLLSSDSMIGYRQQWLSARRGACEAWA